MTRGKDVRADQKKFLFHYILAALIFTDAPLKPFDIIQNHRYGLYSVCCNKFWHYLEKFEKI